MLILLLITLTSPCSLTNKSPHSYLLACRTAAGNMELLDHHGNRMRKLKEMCRGDTCSADYHIGEVKAHQLVALVNDTMVPVDIPISDYEFWIFNSLHCTASA